MATPRSVDGAPGWCQQHLIATDVGALRQAQVLLARMQDRFYVEPPPGFAAHRVGAHLRHILEFYECFLDGVESGHVDYDARRRDGSVEASRHAALARIASIIHRLENTLALPAESKVTVRMEDAPADSADNSRLVSSLGRELQVLASHTVHHFALIAMTLSAHGFRVERDFGVAPSTLRYRSSLDRGTAVEAAQCAP